MHLLLPLLLGLASGTAHAASEIFAHLPVEPVSLDPATADDDFSARVLANSMEGLVAYDGKGRLQNRLARSYESKNKGLRYVFHLRPDARWSDGKPVTAGDFVYGFRRLLDAKTGASMASLYFMIRGARAYHEGKAGPEALGVSADGDKVVFDLEKPASYFVASLAQPQALPARRDVLESNKGRWLDTGPSTGAYRVVSRKREQEIRLEPNPQHYRKRAKELSPVTFRIVTDETTAVRLFETGKLDTVTRLPAIDTIALSKKPEFHQYAHAATYFLSFNTRVPPFNDREFRRAVAGSVEREAIISAVGALAPAAASFVPPGMTGYYPFEKHRFDFSASVAAVAKRVAASPVSITAAFNESAANRTLMEKLQADLKKKLGIDVSLSPMDWASYVSQVRNNTPQLYRFGRGAPFLDPIWHLSSFQGSDPNNPTGWKNAEYDALVDAIATLPDGAERRRKVDRAQRILVDEEALVVPVCYMFDNFLVSPKLKGFSANPLSITLFEEVRKD